MKRHNFTQLNLLRNKDFYLVNKEDAKIYFKVPTVEDFIVDEDMQTLLSILNLQWKTLELNTQINNVYELVLFMAFNGVHTEAIATTIYKFVPESSVQTNGIFVEGKRMTPEEFEFITNCWLIALGSKALNSLESTIIEEELDPIQQRIKENEEKIKKIKQKKEKTQESLQLDKMIIAVIKDFNKNMEEIMALNIYTLLWYYNYSLRLNNYRIETIAYGNGLIKKHRYFTE